MLKVGWVTLVRKKTLDIEGGALFVVDLDIFSTLGRKSYFYWVFHFERERVE
jgi:hypothetical protein